MQISKGEKLTLIIKSLNFQFIISAFNFQSSSYCIQTNREDLEKLPLEIQQRKSKFSFCALGLSHNSKEQRGARHNKIRGHKFCSPGYGVSMQNQVHYGGKLYQPNTSLKCYNKIGLG